VAKRRISVYEENVVKLVTIHRRKETLCPLFCWFCGAIYYHNFCDFGALQIAPRAISILIMWTGILFLFSECFRGVILMLMESVYVSRSTRRWIKRLFIFLVLLRPLFPFALSRWIWIRFVNDFGFFFYSIYSMFLMCALRTRFENEVFLSVYCDCFFLKMESFGWFWVGFEIEKVLSVFLWLRQPFCCRCWGLNDWDLVCCWIFNFVAMSFYMHFCIPSFYMKWNKYLAIWLISVYQRDDTEHDANDDRARLSVCAVRGWVVEKVWKRTR